ncbi:hypothetical protein EAG_12808 [Camponotus floridanus]|uniref:Uncharacterized protein n=1 Tax=Camponotus floridanus TaxID=104421 RepID=E2AT31_CAMFO|nr:hypothetical protein EAG_12808 [Camponotus floridanus]
MPRLRHVQGNRRYPVGRTTSRLGLDQERPETPGGSRNTSTETDTGARVIRRESRDTSTRIGFGKPETPGKSSNTSAGTGTGAGVTRRNTRDNSIWGGLGKPETPGRAEEHLGPGEIWSGSGLDAQAVSALILTGDSPTWRITQVGHNCENSRIFGQSERERDSKRKAVRVSETASVRACMVASEITTKSEGSIPAAGYRRLGQKAGTPTAVATTLMTTMMLPPLPLAMDNKNTAKPGPRQNIRKRINEALRRAMNRQKNGE